MTAVVCHATCMLLRDGCLTAGCWSTARRGPGLPTPRRYADEYVNQRIQPFWIEDQAGKLQNTNFIVGGRFKPHAVRDGNLITGQQQYSGAAAARLIIEALELTIVRPGSARIHF